MKLILSRVTSMFYDDNYTITIIFISYKTCPNKSGIDRAYSLA